MQCKQKGWDGGVILFTHNSKCWQTVAVAAEHRAHLKETGAGNSFPSEDFLVNIFNH